MNQYFSSERDRHLFSNGPKRILSLDGGGVRGVIALAYLERVEALLKERHGEKFRLCDYFDLIGGTSTGSIIATGLALGMEVAELIHIYVELSYEGFHGSRWHGGIFVPKFRSRPLMDAIRHYVGDETLGSEKLLTGLAIVAKRIDTHSVWVFHNNPRGAYFNPTDAKSTSVPNKDLPLAQIIRASTAAPTFFAPERIEIARGVSGTFVDGGVSPHNNPALRLFMLATLKGYGLNWPVGEERMLLASVGTGFQVVDRDLPTGSPSAALAVAALHSMMDDSNWLTQMLLQWVSASPTPWAIDSEVGDLTDDLLIPERLLHYLRYDLALDRDWLQRELSLSFTPKKLKQFSAMDRPDVAAQLLDLGRAAAKKQIREAHFPKVFDLESR